MLNLEVWMHSTMVQRFTPDANGNVSGTLDLSKELNGPLVLDVYAWSSPLGDNTYQYQAKQRLLLFITGGADYVAPKTPTGATDMYKVFEDNFTSLSASSSDNTATWFPFKPEPGGGYSSFGDAPFTDPASGKTPFFQKGSFVRIRVTNDSSGWWGGMLSLGKPGGVNGQYFAAPFYMECRLLSPAGETPWPAFWMLTQKTLQNIAGYNVEIDAVENLGRFPTNFRQGGIFWDAPGGPVFHSPTGSSPGTFPNDTGMFDFHTYGVKVDATNTTFFMDDVQTSSYPTDQLPDGGLAVFPMVNLALGSEWANTVPPAGYYDMWVDFVRVWKSPHLT
jgi:hypothetical protein